MTQDTLMTDAATPTEGAATTQAAPATDAVQQAPADPGTQQAKPADAPKPTGAPEQYEDFTFEEGKALDGEIADDIKGLAKELDLPQDKAQKLADLALKRSDLAASRQAEALEKARSEWADTTRADKEIGGDAFDANLAVAKKGLDAFGTPELKGLLNETGLGNHPEVIRFMYRAGKAISEDRVVTGSGVNAPAADPKRLYPNSNMN